MAPTSRPRPPLRRIAMVAGGSAVAAAVALTVAAAMNDPVGAAPQDPGPLVVGAVNPPGSQTTTAPGTTTSAATLSPMSLVLARPVGGGIDALSPEQQVVRLRDLIATRPTAYRYTALGRAYMTLQDRPAATAAFTHALALAPADTAALTGRIMSRAVGRTGELAGVSRDLTALGRRHPADQAVMFNLGWVALYRRDAAGVRSAWSAAVAINPKSSLGRFAAQVLAKMGTAGR